MSPRSSKIAPALVERFVISKVPGSLRFDPIKIRTGGVEARPNVLLIQLVTHTYGVSHHCPAGT